MDLKTVMEYSLHDNKRKSPFVIEGDASSNKAEFKKHFFVDYPDTIDLLIGKLNKAIFGESINTIIFYGASGSGKTTFLDYYAEQSSEKIDFRFINLIEEPATLDSEECIRKTVLSKIYNLVNKEDDKTTSELYDFVVKQEAIRFFEKKEDNDAVFDYLVANQIGKQNAEDFLGYIGLDGDGKIIKGINTNQGFLVLYLVLELIKIKEEDKGKKVVFVFDNLDEIPTQYIYKQSYKLILSAFSIVQEFCENTLNYDFLGNCTFILSYRSTNAQIIDRCQFEDRLILATENIEFRNEYQVSYSKILSKRLQYYCDKNDKTSLQDNEWRVRELLNSEKEYCTKVIRPLFNYDFRMFNHFFVSHLLEKGLDKVDDSLIITPEPNQKKQRSYQTGARGIIMYYALSSMLKDLSLRLNSYVNHEFDRGDLCNIYRMSFALLSNLGGWALQDDDLVNAIKEENSFNDENPRINFYEFAKRVEKWYDKEMFKSVIEGLIGSVSFNFEYPVTLVGSLVDDYFSDRNNAHSTSGLAKYIVNVYSENESLLANVNVKINPLCVIYCWRVFIHFEYFNLISGKWSNPSLKDFKYVPVPLFQITNEHMLTGCLNSVFATVTNIIGKADEHFCQHCYQTGSSKCKIKEDDKSNWRKSREEVGSSYDTCNEIYKSFVDDGFCINKTMYAIRVITSHLNYLDQYKSFIWEKMSDTPDVLYKLQTIVLKQMDKYLSLWEKRRVVDNKISLLTKFKDKVNKAREQLEEMKCEPIGIMDEEI